MDVIMSATREEEPWLTGIAGTVVMNWLRTTPETKGDRNAR
jgi:hypothetical protein